MSPGAAQQFEKIRVAPSGHDRRTIEGIFIIERTEIQPTGVTGVLAIMKNTH